MMRWITICLILFTTSLHAQHPVAFATTQDFNRIKSALSQFPLLQKTKQDLVKLVEPYLDKMPDIPLPKDPAGGYTHDRHRDNYLLIYNAGLLYQLSADKRYAKLVKDMLMQYAQLNPTLPRHPQATSSSPGRIFWQALNDANWLVYAGLGYDLVYTSISPQDRKTIEDGAFKPEVDYLTGDLESWFNLVHNHGVWACAGVGIVGIASNNEDYIQKALYGTKKDGKGGYMSQLAGLFSPDGYYTEGPYYVRYALLPFYVFANALHRAKPSMRIFEHRGQILKKALNSSLQLTNIDGRFLPINDALKEKDFTSSELVLALNMAWSVYGPDSGWLAVARKQNKVSLHHGGAMVAAALKDQKNIPNHYTYQSVEYTDGADGKQGGLSLMRMGSGDRLTSLVFKYASHGLSHGHYDRLGYFMHDQGHEIFQDYGSVRFVNVEQKYGGRYLPENKSYASQTIAHNTLVVDETSHFNGKESEAEKYAPQKLFSSLKGPAVQVVSAVEKNAYRDLAMKRTLFMIQLPGTSRPIVVDIFSADGNTQHQYDLPFQYSGQVINTSFAYLPFTSVQERMGTKNGYQHLWKEAEAWARDTTIRFTFLNHQSFYTISSWISDSAQLFFTRSGAGDPDFNMRHEPAFMIRKKGKTQDFISVLELHGKFDPVAESTSNAQPSVRKITVLEDSGVYTLVQVDYKEKVLVLALSKNDFETKTKHRLTSQGKVLEWSGPWGVWYDGKFLQ